MSVSRFGAYLSTWSSTREKNLEDCSHSKYKYIYIFRIPRLYPTKSYSNIQTGLSDKIKLWATIRRNCAGISILFDKQYVRGIIAYKKKYSVKDFFFCSSYEKMQIRFVP